MLRLYDRIVTGFAVLAGISYVLVTLGIILDVTLRNLDMRPLQATSALVEYALLFSTMAAGPWMLRIGGHVAVESFVAMLPAALRRLAAVLVMVLSVAVLALLCWRAGVGALEEHSFGGMDMRSVNIPGWISYAILSAGFGLMALEVLRQLLSGATSLGGSQNH